MANPQDVDYAPCYQWQYNNYYTLLREPPHMIQWDYIITYTSEGSGSRRIRSPAAQCQNPTKVNFLPRPRPLQSSNCWASEQSRSYFPPSRPRMGTSVFSFQKQRQTPSPVQSLKFSKTNYDPETNWPLNPENKTYRDCWSSEGHHTQRVLLRQTNFHDRRSDFDLAMEELEKEYRMHSTKLAVSCILVDDDDAMKKDQLEGNAEVEEAVPYFNMQGRWRWFRVRNDLLRRWRDIWWGGGILRIAYVSFHNEETIWWVV